MTSTIPTGMIEVPKTEFFARLMAEKRNIHPSPERHRTDWMLVNTRTRWGWGSQGYDIDRGRPEVYALANV